MKPKQKTVIISAFWNSKSGNKKTAWNCFHAVLWYSARKTDLDCVTERG